MSLGENSLVATYQGKGQLKSRPSGTRVVTHTYTHIHTYIHTCVHTRMHTPLRLHCGGSVLGSVSCVRTRRLLWGTYCGVLKLDNFDVKAYVVSLF